jgi:DNA polymerase-1
MKTLLLVDGSSYLYRAFHQPQLGALRSPAGEPTGVLHGVLNMLRRAHADYKPDYSACVFDAKGKTFRDDWYPEYKANRPPMPDELAAQIPPLRDAIKAMGWPLVMIEGVEADDVIGTLCAKAAVDADLRCIVSTGDKDLAQLVNPQVTLINTMSNEKLDREGVIAKFGLPPERLIDYFALVGDAVDNVPGVDKVGPKTAVKWLSQYGTLDEVIAHAGEISGVVGENLRKSLDWLPQARRLVTVKCDVDLPMTLDDLAPHAMDRDKLVELYSRFGMRTLLREVQGEKAGGKDGKSDADRAEQGVPSRPADTRNYATLPTAPKDLKPAAAQGKYETIVDAAALDAWLAKLKGAKLVCVDTETTSLEPMNARLVGLSFSVEPLHAAYLPLAHRYAGAPLQLDEAMVLEKLKAWYQDPKARKVGQNLKYDRHVLANHGIELAGIEHDTLLESYVLESDKAHDMDALAARHLGLKTITFAEVAGKGAQAIGFEQVSIEAATTYSAEDADVTLQLHHHMLPLLDADAKLAHIYRGIEMPVLEVLYRMERNGVLIDPGLLVIQSGELGVKMLETEKKAHEVAGGPFNLNSPKQIQEILFEKQGLPVVKKTPSGTPSTDEDVLQQLADDYPLPKLILDYRGLTKLKSTYTDKLPRMVNERTGRVHTNYGQAVAVTGRLASTDPNLQNIPVRTAEGRRIREAFIAPPGSHIVSADYSQIELRIMAHISQDASLLRAFAAGEDVHRATAAEVFGLELGSVSSEQRRYAKVINFGLIYGMSAFGLAKQLGLERSAAQNYIQRYFERYPGVDRYMKETRELARTQGYVETVLGRRLWLPEIKSGSPGRRQGAERAAINAPMQGTAADIVKLAMIAVQGWLDKERLSSKLIMQVHDELVLEVPDKELARITAEVPVLMSGVMKLDVPLEVDVGHGPNWEQAH